MKCKVILILIFFFNARVEGSIDSNITNWKQPATSGQAQSVWQSAGAQPPTVNTC